MAQREIANVTGVDTATRILMAAERQFAEQGIDGASLREISRLAGGNNTGAVHYHFGDRAGLVAAVIARRRRMEDLRRHTLLDEYERRGRDDTHGLAGAMVIPLASHLGDPDGGRPYLQVAAEYHLRIPVEDLHRHLIPDTSWQRWIGLASELLPRPADAPPPWLAAISFTHMELGRRALTPGDEDEDARFTSRLTDMVAAVLMATSRPDRSSTCR